MKETKGCPDLEHELARQDLEINQLKRRVEDLENQVSDLENALAHKEDWR